MRNILRILFIAAFLSFGQPYIGAVHSTGGSRRPLASGQLSATLAGTTTRLAATNGRREQTTWRYTLRSFVSFALVLIGVGITCAALFSWLMRAVLPALADRAAHLSLLGSVIMAAVAIAAFVEIAGHYLSTRNPSAVNYSQHYADYIQMVRRLFAVLYGGLVCVGGIGIYLVVRRRSTRPTAKLLLHLAAFVLFLGLTLPFAETENACRLGQSLWYSAHGCN